jgi:hypothetical protein
LIAQAGRFKIMVGCDGEFSHKKKAARREPGGETMA